MMMTLIPVLLWFCALGCGLLAGLYFAFSVFTTLCGGRAGHVRTLASLAASALFVSALIRSA